MNPKGWMQPDVDKKVMVQSAALILTGAAFLSLFERAIPGGPHVPLVPGVFAFAFALILLLVGTRLPFGVLATLGPVGTALIAFALSSGPIGDGAVLYMWPVLWQSYFFGRRGAILIVLWTGVCQAASLLGMTEGTAGLDRWLDVVVSVAVVAAVVEFLARRNRELVAKLEGEARVDKLTGLLNRRGFEERAQIELGWSRRQNSSVGIASFDLDHFKAVNDEFGHGAGDRVLVRMSDAFRAEMRETDVLARMGGEEFVALLPGSDVGDAERFAERARVSLALAGTPELPGVTVSVGITAAVAPTDLQAILARADAALYAAKVGGRNRIVTREAVPSR
jgi:diguanylate cyclase (GGDEF)-like protein